ncbi:thrombospondin type-1 domain-containing protein [Azospirillum argentinense]|uniref:Abnormal spindle-like microcephaly-associated protein ASH domain-containing protein n=1 Tax=Azospirillum argentinense TaxID=2970906 RepID=A0A5B0KMG4_9PROT|nr:thrombospondin type-1 domain-containing protein [Azospirillum argentinense]KAA1053867.1 hypothetical protein FH063_002449 [Azospirillum argentinense]
MRKFIPVVLSLIMASPLTALAQSGSSIELRVKNAGEATGPSGTTYPSVVNSAAPRPDALVTGSHVTITDFRDIVISVDGAPSASTSITLQDGEGTPAGTQDVIPLFMDKPLSAAITSGGEHFRIIDDKCTGKLLGAPNTSYSTCEVMIEPRATWWGPLSGNLRLSSGSYSMDLPLSGTARHFDPLRLALSVISGDPANFDVNGAFSRGNLFAGTPAYSTENVTFRVANLSSEYATPRLATILSNTANFEFVTDGCSGASLPPNGACDMVVRGKSTWWGNWSGTLQVASVGNPEGDPDITLTTNLAGRAHHFDPPRLAITTVSGDPTHLDVLGPAQPSYSEPLVLRVRNLSTEFPTYPLDSSLAATSGPGSFEFLTNGCAGAALAVMGTCDISLRARASWWGPIASAYSAHGNSEAGTIGATQELLGRAHRFDPLTLEISAVTGNPTEMDVFGPGTATLTYSSPVTLRVRNRSTEYATTALAAILSNSNDFEFVAGANGCSGAVLPPGATCDAQVRAKAAWFADLSGVLTVSASGLPDAQDDAVAQQALVARAHHFDPVTMSVTAVTGDSASMDVVGTGDGTLAFSAPVTLRVRNHSSEYTTTSLTTALSNPDNFAFISDDCSARTLAPNATCEVTTRAKSDWWGGLAGIFTVTAVNLPDGQGTADAQIDLTGRAYHFDAPRPTLTLVSGDPALMDITGWAKNIVAYSSAVSYRVTNESTEESTEPLSLGFNNSGNFEFTSDGCAGVQLTPGASCSVTFRAKAVQNGSFTGTLTVDNHKRPSVSLAGTGKQFFTYSWVTGSWAGCTANPTWGGWGTCSSSCGSGTQSRGCNGTSGTETRAVSCQRDDGTDLGAVADTYPGCDTSNRPSASQGCTRSCAGSSEQACYDISTCTYSWADWTGWGACSASCGGGSTSGSQNCKRSDGAYVDWSNCNPAWAGTWEVSKSGSTYTWGTSCNTHDCCEPRNHVTAYGSWSASCGTASRTVYWSNGCGSDWTETETANRGSCENCGQAQNGWIINTSNEIRHWGQWIIATNVSPERCKELCNGRGSGACNRLYDNACYFAPGHTLKYFGQEEMLGNIIVSYQCN